MTQRSGYSPAAMGNAGSAATIAVGSVTGLAAGATPTVTNSGTSAAAKLDFGIPAGAAGGPGSNATATPLATTAPAALAASAAVGSSTSAARADHVHPLPVIPAATPLGTATPKALGTATAGTSANASREDHVHPLPAGRLEFIADLNVTETLLISLSAGMKRKTFAVVGVATTDKLTFVVSATPTAGCEVVNINPGTTSGNVSVGYYTPLLGIGATYSMPISIYRIV